MPRSYAFETVVGLLCVNQAFRTAFFQNPTETAKDYLGDIFDSSDTQRLMAMAAKNTNDADGINRLAEGMNTMSAAFNCPNFPCPGSN